MMTNFIFADVFWTKLHFEFDTFVLPYIGWLDRIQEFVNCEDVDDDLDSFIFGDVFGLNRAIF